MYRSSGHSLPFGTRNSTLATIASAPVTPKTRWWLTLKADPERYAKYRVRTNARRRINERTGGRNHATHVASNKRRQDRRTAQLAAIKVAAGCIDCGYNASADALQFDHVDPTQKVNQVSRMRGVSAERLTAELDKCVVRCANCHMIRSAEQRRQRWAK